MLNQNCSSLSFQDLIFNVCLGATKAEQLKPQQIAVDLTIGFKDLPPACFTDNLQETICYSKLTDNISEFCLNKKFNLIECLGKQLHDYIYQTYPQVSSMVLKVKKTPSIAGIGKCVFTINSSNTQ